MIGGTYTRNHFTYDKEREEEFAVMAARPGSRRRRIVPKCRPMPCTTLGNDSQRRCRSSPAWGRHGLKLVRALRQFEVTSPYYSKERQLFSERVQKVECLWQDDIRTIATATATATADTTLCSEAPGAQLRRRITNA